MFNPIQPGDTAYGPLPLGQRPKLLPRELAPAESADRVDFGGEKVSPAQAQGVVLERAYEKLRGIVGDARAALGIPEGAVIDTSPDATANRIADFALGFFSKYAENNGLADDEAGRKQFADFIGGAIGQGIDEARGILNALSVLDGDIAKNVDKTQEIVQSRLDDFVKNGLTAN
jgi:hypothetical protein